MSAKLEALEQALRRVHEHLRDIALASCRQKRMDELARTVARQKGDVTLGVDWEIERLLPELLEREVGPIASMVVLFEGQGDKLLVIPEGTAEDDAEYCSLWDPLDGSRGYAYQIRSAWILSAVAPNRGPATHLQDAVIAVQTELPLLNQRESVVLSVVKGRDVNAELVDTQSGSRQQFALAPSGADSIENGWVANECFFDGPTALLAEIEESVVQKVLGRGEPGAARVWRETYISSAGVLFELISGKVRWAHDVRPLVQTAMRRKGLEMSLVAHPYDVCTAPLLATALGVLVTGPWGEPLDGSFDGLEDAVSWLGYSSDKIRQQIEPVFQEVLREFLSRQ